MRLHTLFVKDFGPPPGARFRAMDTDVQLVPYDKDAIGRFLRLRRQPKSIWPRLAMEASRSSTA